jgi:PRTRC genetic system protein B
MSVFSVVPALAEFNVRAVQALIVHQMHDGNRVPDFVLTTHEVENSTAGSTLGAGRFVTEADIAALVDVLIGMYPGRRTFLPEDVVSASPTQLAWYRSEEIRAMWFRANDARRKLIVPWPTLLFRARPGELSIVALSHSRRPTADQPLYHAPLMNIHADTRLCAGTATIPPACGLEHKPAYEFCVYGTAFSHVNHDHTLKSQGKASVGDSEHFKFWRQLERRQARRFPRAALVPLKQSVGEWLDVP